MADNVEQLRAALRECPPDHPDLFRSYHSLATSLYNRFTQQSMPSDLDEAIDLNRVVLALCPSGPNHQLSLKNLSICLRLRFKKRGTLSDLSEVVDLRRAALALHPPGHSDRYISLDELGINLRDKFLQFGILSDLNEAIDLHRAALSLCPDSERALSLHFLANSLQDRFTRQNVLSDLNEAIDLHRSALALRPPGHSNRFWSLNGLANCLQDRFKQQGILSELNEAIDLHRAALALCPPGHSDRSWSLNNLANCLQDRYKRQGILSDSDEAIGLHRAALALCPPGHPNRALSLNNLANDLEGRFEQQGVLDDLDEAIVFHRASLALRPPGHSTRSFSLNGLANCLQGRFKQKSIPSDLNEAVDLHRAALALRPPGHSERSSSLDNLANSLKVRFVRWSALSDLDEAIDLHRAALTLCPPGHSERTFSLNHLATDLRARFLKQGTISDLVEATNLYIAAFKLCPPGHSNRSSTLNNLALCLQDRFKQQNMQSVVDAANFDYHSALVVLHRTSLAHCPTSHSDRPLLLYNLADSLHDRFIERGILSDLNDAIDLRRAALALLPPGHSNRSKTLNGLANGLLRRIATEHGQLSDLDEAFRLYAQLLQVPCAISLSDLLAARAWADSAALAMHGSVLAAYRTALKFLDDWQHVAGLSPSSRNFEEVREATSSLAVDAFSCSVSCSAFTTAVELVEQGRTVFWTQLARFHAPLDEIASSGPTGNALAKEFKQLSISLRNMLDASESGTFGDQSTETRQLTMQLEDVISRIRALPGFSRFLLHPLFSDLQKAAEDGPVIIVNACKYGCDALIVLYPESPVHIPLDISQTEVSDLSGEFKSLTEDAGTSEDQLEAQNIAGILRTIWERIVSPIVTALKRLRPRGSRIWWCPTAEFTLLPLHAAGPYEKKKHNLSHYYISSYTTTLAALIRARQQISRDASTLHFVAIGQGNPSRGIELPRVNDELDAVAHRVKPILPFTSLADSDATVQGALDALGRHQWLHLACHGVPDPEKPFESSFTMHDGPLTITDIIRPHMENPEFAFLSACHTTVGHPSSPDEAIHLAAAMQFSGFRSVIGSMWTVDDDTAGELVSAFYDSLMDGSETLDCTRAAGALHKAVKKLHGKIPIERLIVFMHTGV